MPGFTLPERVTVTEAGDVATHALTALQTSAANESWVIDASALQTFDSACLALLLELRRHAGRRDLQVRGAPPRLEHLATAYGLDFALVAAASPAAQS